MFEEKYRIDNQSIVPDEQAKRYIKAKIIQNSQPKRINFNAIIAIALSLVLALGVTLIAKNPAPINQYVGESTLMENLTYDTIYNSINKYMQKQSYDSFIDIMDDGFAYLTGGLARDEAATGTAEPSAGQDNGTVNLKGESSTTNNQVQGVDEADLVKNDGRYIYSIKDGFLVVTDSNNGNPKLVTKKSLTTGGETVTGLYVNGNRLAVIIESYRFSGSYAPNVKIAVLDITDKENIKVIKEINQNGYYNSSRMIGDTVYLLSNHYVRDNIDRDKAETYVPCVDNAAIRETDICVIEDFESPSYLVVSSVDMEKGQIIDNTAILGGAQNVYCNNENLFYTFTKNEKSEAEGKVEYKNETTIVKLSLKNGIIKTEATGKVTGMPLNQFSMDEYQNNLRIVTTVDITTHSKSSSFVSSADSTTKNALYVLDKDLKQIGQIEDLAKGERVYSVRFSGEIGYFVTFKQVDPLFTVDLKDPADPKILSELKIPGFSEYLHPYGEGRLFGFGKSATEQGSVTGLKISMFDVSNPADVSELHLSSVPADWSEASENHKAIMVDAKKNIIAFIATDDVAKTRLFVYGYSEGNGFFKKAEAKLTNDSFYYGARLLWINDYFYVVTKDSIVTFSLDTFEKLNTLEF